MVPAVTEVCSRQPAHSHVHALVCSCQALVWPQWGADKAVRSTHRGAGRLIRETLLEFNQRVRDFAHGGLCSRLCSFILYQIRALRHHALRHRTQRNKPLLSSPWFSG